ncbi:MAG: Arc family DNA-binding protein [Thermoleophilia bacterium]|nr:Arc family DNA-binding protein [Thermoleophilia bacterium]
MASLSIRDLDDAVRDRLRLRAAGHGRSMEAEVRAILTAAVEAVEPVRGLVGTLRDRVVAEGVVDLPLPPRAVPPRDIPPFG